METPPSTYTVWEQSGQMATQPTFQLLSKADPKELDEDDGNIKGNAHVRNGLPPRQELRTYIKKEKVELIFRGSFFRPSLPRHFGKS